MDINERMMVERFELGDAREDSALRRGTGAAAALSSLALVAVAGALLVATVQAVGGWSHLVVLGALLFTTLGLMIALAPSRNA